MRASGGCLPHKLVVVTGNADTKKIKKAEALQESMEVRADGSLATRFHYR
jgi:hypothetical protein